MRLRTPAAVAAIAVMLVVTLVTSVSAAVYQAAVRPAYAGDDDMLVFLIIGSDIGPPQRPGDPLTGRADAIHLIAVEPADKTATVVDIPRDSLVGGEKINAYLAFSGPEGLRDRLADLTGVEIDYWALSTFQGFKQLVEDTGGIEVDVDAAISDEAAQAELEAGRQRLTGEQALAFSRARKTLPDGDFGRTRHQGELIKAAHAELHQRDLAGTVELVAALLRNIETDIPADQILPLAFLAAGIKPSAVHQEPLSGDITSGSDGDSAVELNPGDVFERLQAGETGPPAQDSDPS